MHDGLTRALRVGIALALITLIATAGVVTVPEVVGADHSFVVLSGSMRPTLQPGDVVVERSASPDDIRRGDVVTFYRPGTTGADRERITHRVVAIERTDHGVAYRTKGDHNDHRDPWLVDQSHVVGVVWFHIPVAGRALLLVRDSGLQPLLLVGAGVLLLGSGLGTLRGQFEGAE